MNHLLHHSSLPKKVLAATASVLTQLPHQEGEFRDDLAEKTKDGSNEVSLSAHQALVICKMNIIDYGLNAVLRSQFQTVKSLRLSEIGKIYLYEDFDLAVVDVRDVHPEDLNPLQSSILREAACYFPLLMLTNTSTLYLWNDFQANFAGVLVEPISAEQLGITSNHAIYQYRMQQRLRKECEWNKLKLEKAVDGILTCTDGGIIETVNVATAELFGYHKDEMVGKNVSMLMNAEEASQHDTHIERYLETGKSKIVGVGREVMAVRKDGSRIPVYIAVSHINQFDKKQFVAIIRDMTETHHAREALLQAKEAAIENNRLKSEFIANISHELRTPLHGVLSCARFGIEDSHAHGLPEIEQHFQDIKLSASTLLETVNELLDLEKLEAGRMIFDFSDQDIRPFLKQVADEFRSRCAELRLKITLQLPTVPIACLVDENRLQQLIRNLVGNAVKFSSPESEIILGAEATETDALIYVRDQGPGIPTGELTTVFDKFTQSSLTRKGSGGTGLGLSICKEIAESHQGNIWAENVADGGAVFFVTIPMTANGTELQSNPIH